MNAKVLVGGLLAISVLVLVAVSAVPVVAQPFWSPQPWDSPLIAKRATLVPVPVKPSALPGAVVAGGAGSSRGLTLLDELWLGRCRMWSDGERVVELDCPVDVAAAYGLPR